jgi:hypothetical protein
MCGRYPPRTPARVADLLVELGFLTLAKASDRDAISPVSTGRPAIAKSPPL